MPGSAHRTDGMPNILANSDADVARLTLAEFNREISWTKIGAVQPWPAVTRGLPAHSFQFNPERAMWSPIVPVESEPRVVSVKENGSIANVW